MLLNYIKAKLVEITSPKLTWGCTTFYKVSTHRGTPFNCARGILVGLTVVQGEEGYLPSLYTVFFLYEMAFWCYFG